MTIKNDYNTMTIISPTEPVALLSHSTACLIEPLVISNTTAHNIDAHDKLATT